MSIVQNIPDAASFFISLCDICLAGAFVGCILMLFESAFVLGFHEEKPVASGAQPAGYDPQTAAWRRARPCRPSRCVLPAGL